MMSKIVGVARDMRDDGTTARASRLGGRRPNPAATDDIGNSRHASAAGARQPGAPIFFAGLP